MEEHLPAAIAFDPEGAAERREVFYTCGRDAGGVCHQKGFWGELLGGEVSYVGMEKCFALQQIENLLLVPDATCAAELAEVVGEDFRDGFAVTPELWLQKLLFKRA